MFTALLLFLNSHVIIDDQSHKTINLLSVMNIEIKRSDIFFY